MNRPKSERTQGTRLRLAQEILLHISSFSNYQPAHPDDQVANFAQLVQQLEQTTLNTSAAESAYRLATEQRQKAFHTDEFSVQKLLPYLRTLAEVYAGKKSRQYDIISGMLAGMRGRPRAIVQSSIGAATSGALEPRSVSRSQMSYASLQLHFRKVVDAVASLNYHTNIPQLELPQLQQFAAQLEQLSNQVEQRLSEMDRLRNQRADLETRIDAAIPRIRGYVRCAYGNDSDEYNALK